MAVPILTGDAIALLVFLIFVSAAVYWRAKAATHKRLMLLASPMILGPAFSSVRPVGQALDPFLGHDVPWFGFVGLSVAALVWHDYATTRRLQPATLWGTVVLVAALTLMFVVSGGAIGPAIAHWLVGFA